MILAIVFILILGGIFIKSRNRFQTSVVFLLTVMLLLILSNPSLCISYAHNGIKLFFTSVFPSLFPFTVITSLILSFNGIIIYSKLFGRFLCNPLNLPRAASFPLIVSLICGFPLGAKYTGSLRHENILSRGQATTTLIVASNASPLFVIGVVGSVLFKNIYIGYMLFIINILSCYISGMIFAPKEALNLKRDYIPVKKVNVGNAIRQSIETAMNTTLIVCSYITFFSVIIGYINHYLSIMLPVLDSLAGSFLLGLIELTNGVTLILGADVSHTMKLVFTSFLISFSGLSIFSQVYSLVHDKDLSFKKYFVAKILQGVISSTLTLTVLLSSRMLNISKFASNTAPYHSISTFNLPAFPVLYCLLCLTFILSFQKSKGLLE